jgi:hypothetical protein
VTAVTHEGSTHKKSGPAQQVRSKYLSLEIVLLRLKDPDSGYRFSIR